MYYKFSYLTFMKKLLTIFIVLISFVAQGQIKNDFWGLKLGASTKNQVQSTLKSQKKTVVDHEVGLLMEGPILFGGERWNWVTFHFNDNTLMGVIFTMVSQNSNYDTFIQLGETLSEKYSKYEDDFDVNETESYIQFIDENGIAIKLSLRNDNRLFLMYTDTELLEKEREKNRDNDL